MERRFAVVTEGLVCLLHPHNATPPSAGALLHRADLPRQGYPPDTNIVQLEIKQRVQNGHAWNTTGGLQSWSWRAATAQRLSQPCPQQPTTSRHNPRHHGFATTAPFTPKAPGSPTHEVRNGIAAQKASPQQAQRGLMQTGTV